MMPTTTTPSMVRNFRKVLRRFERLIGNQLELQDCCCGLPYAQCHPLLELDELGQASLGDLARRFDVDKSTMSRTVDTLVNRGLVCRTPKPGDRRFIQLSLSPAGRELCDRINHKNDEYFRKVLERLPAQHRRETVEHFANLVAALEGTMPAATRSRSCCGSG